MKTKKPDESALDTIEEGRREFVKKLVAGTAFAAPLLASFSMDGGLIGEAQAQTVATASYFCTDADGKGGVYDIVYRAAFKGPDNAFRVSAVARADSLDCGTLTVNLSFSSKDYTLTSAKIIINELLDFINLKQGQTVIDSTTSAYDIKSIVNFLDNGDGKIVVTATGPSGGDVTIEGDLVGARA